MPYRAVGLDRMHRNQQLPEVPHHPGQPFPENQWVGGVVRLGDTVRVAVTEPDKRCVMITLDHGTGVEGSPKILRATAELNDACAGVYGAVITPGTVREGDEVTLE